MLEITSKLFINFYLLFQLFVYITGYLMRFLTATEFAKDDNDYVWALRINTIE